MFSGIAGGSTIGTILSYILVCVVPLVFVGLGIRERRRGTEDGKRVATAMFGLAGLIVAVILVFFLFMVL